MSAARAVVAVVELAQLGEELLLELLRVADAEVGEALRQRVDVLGRGVDEEPRQLRHVVVGELPGQAEVDEADLVAAEHEDVRRVRVAVEEPVPEDHRHPALGDQVREPPALLHRPRRTSTSPSCVPSRLERQHPGARVAPVDARDADVRVAGEVAVERLGVAALEPVVELLADRPRELVDDLLGVDEVERAHALLRQPRRLEEQREVGLDLPRRVGALHLDDDAAAVRERRAVHLPDRRRRERLLVEIEEEPLDRLPELLRGSPARRRRTGTGGRRPAGRAARR